jgi:large subunit ribosomal protein L13
MSLASTPLVCRCVFGLLVLLPPGPMRKGGATAWRRHHVAYDKIWRLVDARGQVLGRVATQIARLLMGKHKPTSIDNIFSGDPVVVINARHFALTGRKPTTKHYMHYTGYPGGQRLVPVARVLENRPEDPVRLAVKSMLATNKLRGVRLANLHIYPDEDHPHQLQKPVLMPPAHSGARLGRGGPPTQYELENWWLDQMCLAPDHILHKVLQEIREEYTPKRKGLGQLLDLCPPGGLEAFSSSKATNPNLTPAVEAYAKAADQLARDQPGYPVILPPGISVA